MLGWLRKREVDPRKALIGVLGDHALPSFSGVLTSALAKIRDERVALPEVAEVIAGDPGLSSSLLRTANSAAYALRHPVNNVPHAVTLLGRAKVESMLLSVAVRKALPADPAPGFDPRRFWRAAARRAAVARNLATVLHPSLASESFTAALLGEMAVPVLSSARGAEYRRLLEQWHGEGGDLSALEREAFGWDHPRVASWMCAEWRFPERLAAAIHAHHGSADDGVEGLPAATLVGCLGEVEDGGAGVEELVARVQVDHGLGADEVRSLVETGFAQADEIAGLFQAG